MKNKVKIILPFLFFLLLFGCNLNNTPTSKVEEKLSNYQMLDKSINDNIENGVLILSNNIESSNTEIERYRRNNFFKNIRNILVITTNKYHIFN